MRYNIGYVTLQDLTKLYQKKSIDKSQHKKLQKFIKQKNHLVLTIKNIISPIGIIHARKFKRIAYIEYIFVDKELRGKGISKKMYSFLEKKLKMQGIRKIKLWVYTTNKRAFKFWKKQGFVMDSKTKDRLGIVLYTLEKKIRL